MFYYYIKLKLYTRVIDYDSFGCKKIQEIHTKKRREQMLNALTIVIKHLTLSLNEIVPSVRECIPKISSERVRRKY